MHVNIDTPFLKCVGVYGLSIIASLLIHSAARWCCTRAAALASIHRDGHVARSLAVSRFVQDVSTGRSRSTAPAVIDSSTLSLADAVSGDWYDSIHDGLLRRSRLVVVCIRALWLIVR